MVGVTKFLCVGEDFPNILTKKEITARNPRKVQAIIS